MRDRKDKSRDVAEIAERPKDKIESDSTACNLHKLFLGHGSPSVAGGEVNLW